MFVTTARMSRVRLRSTRAELLSEDVEAGAGAEAAGSFFWREGLRQKFAAEARDLR